MSTCRYVYRHINAIQIYHNITYALGRIRLILADFIVIVIRV